MVVDKVVLQEAKLENAAQQRLYSDYPNGVFQFLSKNQLSVVKKLQDFRAATHSGMDLQSLFVPPALQSSFHALLAREFSHCNTTARVYYYCEIVDPRKFRMYADTDMYVPMTTTEAEELGFWHEDLAAAMPVSSDQLAEYLDFALGYGKILQREGMAKFFKPAAQSLVSRHPLVVCGVIPEFNPDKQECRFGLHWVWTLTLVNYVSALFIIDFLRERLCDLLPAGPGGRAQSRAELAEQFDTDVYKMQGGGLRMVYCQKISKCSACTGGKDDKYCGRCSGTGKLVAGKPYQPLWVLNDSGEVDHEATQRVRNNRLLALENTHVRIDDEHLKLTPLFLPSDAKLPDRLQSIDTSRQFLRKLKPMMPKRVSASSASSASSAGGSSKKTTVTAEPVGLHVQGDDMMSMVESLLRADKAEAKKRLRQFERDTSSDQAAGTDAALGDQNGRSDDGPRRKTKRRKLSPDLDDEEDGGFGRKKNNKTNSKASKKSRGNKNQEGDDEEEDDGGGGNCSKKKQGHGKGNVTRLWERPEPKLVELFEEEVQKMHSNYADVQIARVFTDKKFTMYLCFLKGEGSDYCPNKGESHRQRQGRVYACFTRDGNKTLRCGNVNAKARMSGLKCSDYSFPQQRVSERLATMLSFMASPKREVLGLEEFLREHDMVQDALSQTLSYSAQQCPMTDDDYGDDDADHNNDAHAATAAMAATPSMRGVNPHPTQRQQKAKKLQASLSLWLDANRRSKQNRGM